MRAHLKHHEIKRCFDLEKDTFGSLAAVSAPTLHCFSVILWRYVFSRLTRQRRSATYLLGFGQIGISEVFLL